MYNTQTGIMELKHKKRHFHTAFSVMLLWTNNLSPLKHPDWFWDFLFNGYKRLSLGLKWLGCKLTTHCLEVRLSMKGAIPPGPPCAYMADIGTTLPLHCKEYKKVQAFILAQCTGG